MAWHPLGWEPAAFAEIDVFPSAVLEHHYPHVPNAADFTTIKGDEYGAIDLLVGGTPCQSFSVAGFRGGLGDDRGNLALEFLRLVQRTSPKWVVWENVPGVLSSNGGRDFGSILGGLAELGYGFVYRTLDAQYVRVDGFERAVPQRRRRVFVVGYLGDWRRAAAVLFERESLCWDSAPRRKSRQDVAPTIAARTRGGGGLGTDFDCDGGLIAGCLSSFGGYDADTPTLRAMGGDVGGGSEVSTGDVSHCLNAAGMGRIDYETETMVAHSLRADGFDAGEDGTGRGTPIVPICFSAKDHGAQQQTYVAQAFDMRGREGGSQFEGPHNTANIRAANGGSSRSYVSQQWAVRRLTPKECERLMGFPDDFTLVPYRGKPASDGPRYKALGNSMAVNVMRWIGQRIQMVDSL